MIHFHKKNHRIGLDIDEVCADFLTAYAVKHNMSKEEIKHFYFSYKTNEKLEMLDEDFWLNLDPLVDGKKLNFLPSCYISKRGFSSTITERWLEKNGFPCMPVIHVTDSKLAACKEMNVGIFVDDFIKNFNELNGGGIHTFLMNSSQNQQYDVGEAHRLLDMNDLPARVIAMNL